MRRLAAFARAAAVELARHPCNRVVQLGHFVEGEPGAMKFGFSATVLVPDAAKARRTAGGISYPFEQTYAKRYTYDLTSEMMDRLSPTAVAREAAADLDQAKVLTGRKSSSAAPATVAPMASSEPSATDPVRPAVADATLLAELAAMTPEERLRWNDRMVTTILELRHGFAAAEPDHAARPAGGERR